MISSKKEKLGSTELNQILKTVNKLVAPTWPLKDMVAVNPYFGYSHLPFKETAVFLKGLNDIQLHMPLTFYNDLIKRNKILKSDIEQAIRKEGQNYSVDQFLSDFNLKLQKKENTAIIRTVSDYAEGIIRIKINDIVKDCVSNWASYYFGNLTKTKRNKKRSHDLFQSWMDYAGIDKHPQVLGIKSFKQTLNSIPKNADVAIQNIVERLGLPEMWARYYLLKVAYFFPGWSSYISGIDWNNNLYGGNTNHLNQFIAILLSWELCIFEAYNKEGVASIWKQQLTKAPYEITEDSHDIIETKNILQNAFDISYQRELIHKFNYSAIASTDYKPEFQVAFCIDVRSEVYRRHLEDVNPHIQTIGFAGFFGFPIKYEPIGSAQSINNCPVLLPSGPTVRETADNNIIEGVKYKKEFTYELSKIIKGFRKSPIASFGYVSPLGLFYLPKLLTDSFGITKPVLRLDKVGYSNQLLQRQVDVSGIPFEEQLTMASSALKNMGLTQDFALIVLFAGHGSSSINNPHAAGLACGACGGHSGDVNSLTAATILNDPSIRKGLMKYGIKIPESTIFLAGLHDTLTDELTILNEYCLKDYQKEGFQKLKQHLVKATEKCRLERNVRLNPENLESFDTILKRSKDWAQTRPEWGLAGCSSFIIAPRSITKNIDLNSESFLHDYKYEEDNDLKILEGIMTAPMVVTSWINLQYYASTVDNVNFGAGNKTLHNVTSGIGVLEGSSGDLRIGLPLQSLEYGNKLEHLPKRLAVVIKAPVDAINEVLKKHQMLQDLFDNRWIYLLSMDGNGKITQKYSSNFSWEKQNENFILS